VRLAGQENKRKERKSVCDKDSWGSGGGQENKEGEPKERAEHEEGEVEKREDAYIAEEKVFSPDYSFFLVLFPSFTRPLPSTTSPMLGEVLKPTPGLLRL
jgi:hypothetical protein